MHGDSRGCPCIDRARGAVLSDGENGRDLGSCLVSEPLAFLTEQQHRVGGQVECLNWHATGQIVDADQNNVICAAPCGELRCILVVAYVLISIGDHCSATIPSLAPDNVHFLGQEGIRSTHDRADVEIVIEVLDGHVERMSPRIKILDDGVESPVTVLVNDISTVAVAQQLRIKSIVVGPGKWMRAYAIELEFIVGAGVGLIHMPTIAWWA